MSQYDVALSEDTYLWKIIIKPASADGKAFEFCKKNNIVGVGWYLKHQGDDLYVPKDIDDAIGVARQCYPGQKGCITALNALKEIEINDLIWTRYDGIYYICRVLSKWKYCNDDEHTKEDICHFVNVEYVEVGTIDNVPGRITNCFRSRSAIQRIHDDSHVMTNITKDMYNNLTGKNVYETVQYGKNDILDLLQAEDVEEVVSLYLQVNKNYLVYTSTNKLDTQKYEFVAVARDGSHYCYPQVKTGSVSLDGNNYKDLAVNGNKVFLFATSEAYSNVDGVNIVALTRKEMMDFIMTNKAIMPQRIKQWM